MSGYSDHELLVATQDVARRLSAVATALAAGAYDSDPDVHINACNTLVRLAETARDMSWARRRLVAK